MSINSTHDAALTSWVDSANVSGTDFPIQNLPYGVFRRKGSSEPVRGGVAIGDRILDMARANVAGAFSGAAAQPAALAGASKLNALMAAGPASWTALRLALSNALRNGSGAQASLRDCLVPQSDAEFDLPAQIGDYTDFFASWDHMMNMGRMFQPDSAELPQFKWLPIAYHGRASTVEVSGANFERPWGQGRLPGAKDPYFAPGKRLDYEMEIGCWVGPGNARGEPIGIDEAEDHLFGVCLLNDWSARDVQGWESVPLGPFLAKNFLTTVSPWIVTMEALAPFRCPVRREVGDPPLLPHLLPKSGNSRGGIDLAIEVQLVTPRSEGQGLRLSLSSTRHAYWSFAQMLVHHIENGCAMAPGDLIGSGTHSGPGEGEKGCLMEITLAGRQPVTLPSRETRAMLEDGDTVVLRAWAEKPGAVRIGLGECRGTVLPARPG